MSLAAILAPPVMTQLFGRFTAADAPIYFPGAPFLAAAVCAAISAAILARVMFAPKAVVAATQ
ncbi:MAG: tetracycline resistance MFS efflux pump, partial [Steroidobacteraceae bacterium]